MLEKVLESQVIKVVIHLTAVILFITHLPTSTSKIRMTAATLTLILFFTSELKIRKL